MKRFILAALVWAFAGAALAVQAPPSVPTAPLNPLTVQRAQPPCDLLSSGCLSAWSVVQQMSSTYTGPLFQLYRDDGQQFLIGFVGNSGIVNTNAIHADCDGHDCFVEYLYDQGTGGNLLSNTVVGNMPLLWWNANGLPTIILTQGVNQLAGIKGTRTGSWLINNAPNGLPTTGSRTTYIAEDNFNFSGVAENFGYGGVTTQPGGDIGGDGWTFVVMQTDPNTPSGAIFGNDLENFIYDYGAYSPGYNQLIGMLKYNATTIKETDQILPSSCIPNTVTSCNAQTTYNSTPLATVNTGEGYPLFIRMGLGTDSIPYGGRFQSSIIANYATSGAEDSSVFGALAVSHFKKTPSPCAAAASTFSAGKPNSTTTIIPQSYLGTAALNQSNLVALWSTRLIDADWSGPLFRVQRVDNGVSYDIYPAGCDADQQAITAAGSGTTLNVTRWFDQSGHGWTAKPLNSLLTPALSATGMNGKPCVQFNQVAAASATGSIGATFTGSVSGTTLTASAVSGVIHAGDQLTGTGYPVPPALGTNQTGMAVILSQLSGTTGGAGTYQINQSLSIGSEAVVAQSNILDVTSVASGALTAGQLLQTGVSYTTITGQLTGTAGGTGTYSISLYIQLGSVSTLAPSSSPFLTTDTTVYQYYTNGLYQNQTVEAVWQTTASVNVSGAIVSMFPAWELGGFSTAYTLTYGHNGGADLNYGSTWSLNQAHFAYLTTDNSTPQNLAIAMDNGAITTGTTAFANLGRNGNAYWIGGTYNNQMFKGCIAEVAVYNDIESQTNLTTMYNLAHTIWATP